MDANCLACLRQQMCGKASGALFIGRGKGFGSLDALCTIRAENGGAQGKEACVMRGQRGDRAVAIAAQRLEQGTFGHHGMARFGMVDRTQPCAHRLIGCKAFHANRALGRCREPLVSRQWRSDRALMEAFKPGCGQQRHVGLARGQLAQSRGNIAAKAHDAKIGPHVEHLCGAARRAGANPCALWNGRNRRGPDKHIAHVGARQDGGNAERIGTQGLDILHRMDGEIDIAFGKPRVQFLGPERLAADLGKRTVKHLVAAGSHGDQFDRGFVPAMGGAQARARFQSLRHGQRGIARAEAKRTVWTSRRAAFGQGVVHALLAVTGIITRGKRLMALILGIESSCDETAAAVIDGNGADLAARIVAQRIASQDEAHRPYGGVVPEIAARAHVEVLAPMIEGVLADAGIGLDKVDAIAATAGPGLIGGVMVGLVTAKALAMAADKPLVAVNHLEGHALSPRLADPSLHYPYLLLLVSGGHCQILEVAGVGRYRRLATTIDDALGEAFDKTAKILGLGYPGGPAVERLAREGDPRAVPLPRPLVGSSEPHFSFAGLKSAVMRARQAGIHADADIAASFQQAALDCVVDRTRAALAAAAPQMTALVVAGGVAANAALRGALEALAAAYGLPLIAPPPKLCTDNAAMIGWAGAERFALGYTDPLDVAARPRWPLDANAAPVRGAGVKA